MMIAHAGAAVQAPAPSQRPAAVLFQPLLADPKEPRFFATYLWTRSPRLASRLGSVGLGQTIGLLRGRDWQLGIGAAVFSEVNMQSSTTDLLNTDYLVGLPLTYQHGSLTTRLRLVHQSFHLGGEYMAPTNAPPIGLAFQAVALERLAQGLYRAGAVRGILPGLRFLARCRRRVHTVTLGRVTFTWWWEGTVCRTRR